MSESVDQLNERDAALAARYPGGAVPDVGDLPDSVVRQLSHSSVRQYTAQPVTEQHIAALVAVAQSAATSSNYQFWSVIEVRDQAIKEKIARISHDQQQVIDAPVLLVWVADLARSFQIAAEAGEATPTATADYLETTIVALGDAYLAAQNAVVAAEAMGMGTCYLGAIRNDVPAVAEALGLPEHSFAAVGLTIGWPDPAHQRRIKPRLPQRAVWHKDGYDSDGQSEAVDAYDEAFTAYYAAQGVTRSWKARVLKRLGSLASLSGRERLTSWLSERGLGTR